MSRFVSEKPSPHLRYIWRNGEKILQQLFHIQEGYNISVEWRDVPEVLT